MVSLQVPVDGRAFESTKVGISVAKRQIPLATQRNRLKRQVRHQMARIIPTLPGGSKVVVRVMRGAAGLPSDRVRKELERLIASALGKEKAKLSGSSE